MKNTVILFCCHFLNKKIIKEFKKIKDSCSKDHDIVLLYDNTRNDFKINADYEYHIIDDKVGERIGYKSSEKGISYDGLYPVLDFFLKKSNYEYYWRIEYDVRFAGSWDIFFNHFLDNDSDLLATSVKTYAQNPEWPCWGKLNFNVEKSRQIGIFFPVVRFSNRALKLLDNKFKSGIFGFCEVIVPTLISLEGFKINDIGKKFYDSNTFRFRRYVIKKSGKLLHPADGWKFELRIIIKRLARKIYKSLKFFLKLD